jgi:hypothetical protein
MKGKDWDVVSYLYNSLFVLNYLLLFNLYDSLFVLEYLFSLESDNLFSCLIVYFLCRLKINHGYHVFILEFGTLTNTNDRQGQ